MGHRRAARGQQHLRGPREWLSALSGTDRSTGIILSPPSIGLDQVAALPGPVGRDRRHAEARPARSAPCTMCCGSFVKPTAPSHWPEPVSGVGRPAIRRRRTAPSRLREKNSSATPKSCRAGCGHVQVAPSTRVVAQIPPQRRRTIDLGVREPRPAPADEAPDQPGSRAESRTRRSQPFLKDPSALPPILPLEMEPMKRATSAQWNSRR